MLHHLLIVLFLSCSGISSELLNLREGSACLRNKVAGKCVSIYDCLSSYLDLKDKDYAPICCYRGTEPIICCTDCTFNDTRNLVIDKNLGIIHKTGQKAQDSSACLRNKVAGKCVSIYDCLSSYLDLKDKDYAPICCYRGTEPIICCTDCTFNDTRNLVIDKNLGIIHKTGQKAQDKCIEYIHRLEYPCKGNHFAKMVRVHKPDTNCNEVTMGITSYGGGFGGVNAYREEFPHMGLLGYGDNVKAALWLCGGTVISERFILTAGHCLSSSSLGPVKYVALGILKRTDPPELWQIYNVKRVIPHPEYKSPSKYHDIALLETDTEIVFSKQVLPACLHATGEANKQLYATGWGALGHREELADTLQKVYITRFEEAECSKYYPPHRHLKNGYNHTTQMCYGDKDGRDTCEGDSGGPLQSNSNNYSEKTLFCVYTVIGVTSYGRQCGIAEGSGIYTRVIYYVPWIESVVWP